MPAIYCRITKTHVQSAIDQVLNNASMQELRLWLTALEGGALLGDLISQEVGGVKLDERVLNHVLRDIYDRTGKGWWGPGVEQVATEGIAQALLRMMYHPDGSPRRTAKRLDSYWLCPGAYHYFNAITESEWQITLLAVTPPTPEQGGEWKAFRRTLKKPMDRGIPRSVPDDLRREENVWIVSSTRDALLEGRNGRGKAVPVARAEPSVTPHAGVTVARALCEDYHDVFTQGPSPRSKSKRGARAVRAKRAR